MGINFNNKINISGDGSGRSLNGLKWNEGKKQGEQE